MRVIADITDPVIVGADYPAVRVLDAYIVYKKKKEISQKKFGRNFWKFLDKTAKCHGVSHFWQAMKAK